jgi:hypothetical protein
MQTTSIRSLLDAVEYSQRRIGNHALAQAHSEPEGLIVRRRDCRSGGTSWCSSIPDSLSPARSAPLARRQTAGRGTVTGACLCLGNGIPIPFLTSRSISSLLATPSSNNRAASMSIGIRNRFPTKPGTSFFRTIGSLPREVTRAFTFSTVSSLVRRPHGISTASLTGGGVKKCIPQTLSGLPVAEARSVIDMEEVLVSRRDSGSSISSSAANASFFGGDLLDDSLDGRIYSCHVVRVHAPVDTVVVLLGFLLRKRALVYKARETLADVELGLLQSFDAEIAGDYSMARLGSELDYSGAPIGPTPRTPILRVRGAFIRDRSCGRVRRRAGSRCVPARRSRRSVRLWSGRCANGRRSAGGLQLA